MYMDLFENNKTKICFALVRITVKHSETRSTAANIMHNSWMSVDRKKPETKEWALCLKSIILWISSTKVIRSHKYHYMDQ